MVNTSALSREWVGIYCQRDFGNPRLAGGERGHWRRAVGPGRYSIVETLLGTQTAISECALVLRTQRMCG
jgi:hypothetical protein